jgi:hypothetical protein
VAPELPGWAAERAPDLLARAEADAVAVLRDALVGAVLASRSHAATPERTPGQAPEPAATEPEPVATEPVQGELLWAYCVVPADTQAPDELPGVDRRFHVERIAVGPLAALVSRVPAAEFGAAALRANLNQLDWLERVARAHEAVLEWVLQDTPVVPLRLCTVYSDTDGVRRMLEQERAVLTEALKVVVGRQEWAAKLLVDPERLRAHARASSSEAASMEADLDGLGEAAAYMLRRRLERHVREVAGGVADRVASDLLDRLEYSGIEFVTRPPQNRELSGHEGEMLLNAACLVDPAGLERLREQCAQLEAAHEAVGASVELTGPWPPYNFVLGADAATLA